MADCSISGCMTIDLYVKRRVAEDRSCPPVAHQNLVRFVMQRVSAEEPVLAQEPQISGLTNRRFIRQVDGLILIVYAASCVLEDPVNFGDFESGNRGIEFGAIKRDQMLQFDRKDVQVPVRVLGEFIVGDDVGTNLVL